MNTKLLKLKTIGSTEKLVLMLMLDFPTIALFNLRAGDIAKELGTTRKIILEAISNLVKVEYIETKVISECYSRTTQLTPEFLMLIKEEE
jgi:DNA-binding MarR family transcriptional regulator